MKKGSKLIVIASLVSVLLSFFAFPVYAQTDSSITGVVINRTQRTEAINRDTSTSSSGVNSANVTTYNNTVYYSYIQINEWEIAFTDQNLHSGYIDFTKYLSSSANAVFDVISTSENVAVDGSRVYFSSKSSFILQSYSYAYATTQAPGTVFPDRGLVLNSYTEASGYSVQDAINRIVNTYTRVNSIYNLLNNSETGFAKIIPLLQEIADAEITQQEYDDLLAAVQDVASKITSAASSISSALTSQTSQIQQAITAQTTSITSSLSTLNSSLSQISSKITSLQNTCSQIYSELSAVYTELLDIGLILDSIFSYMQSRIEYDIPVESFFINWSLMYSNSPQIPIVENSYWQKYPIFQMSSGLNFGTFFNSGQEKTIILGVDKNISNSAAFLNYFDVTSGIDIKSFYNYGNSFPQFRFIKVVLKNNTDSGISCYFTAKSSFKVIGIYLSSQIGLTEDFASLWFGSDLQQTADNFESGVDDVISSSDDFGDYSDQLHDMDVGALEDMEDSLQDIDTDAAGNILSITRFTDAANWVRTQYNRMTLNTPFASLITFSLTIGIVLILLGKLRT